MKKSLLGLAALVPVLVGPMFANATIVRFETNLGSFDINLYDEATPLTVANFLAYVESEAYDNTIVHRLEEGFVVQGGGYVYGGKNDSGYPSFDAIDTEDAVTNEPEFSNVKATIAMARVGDSPDSATAQWFINLEDNSDKLDIDRGQRDYYPGYTVFGEVVVEETNDGMSTIATIGELPVARDYSAASIWTYGSLPLVDLADDATNFDDSNLLIVESVRVIDAAIDTAANLDPAVNVLKNDLDQDGVDNELDQCKWTSSQKEADEEGCALYQKDSDLDGVNDEVDQCPGTVDGTSVGRDGCERSDDDSDGGGAGSWLLLGLLALPLFRRRKLA
ncbi:peptidylprolyl isomerase [Agaribacterium haliotis]|uniref:peptidylprolyl isomerase n=1 Tax=Agaribacterium haliotis TaxID=2013869 RepID=UPI000BB55398|nr:peptidylprolyl isomerase [Agaribacterium haliotis]